MMYTYYDINLSLYEFSVQPYAWKLARTVRWEVIEPKTKIIGMVW